MQSTGALLRRPRSARFTYLRAATVLLSAFALTACADRVPTVTQQYADWPLIAGCENVKPDARLDGEFETKFYFTTLGSAYKEGAAYGARVGLEDGGDLGFVMLSLIGPPDSVDGRPVIKRGSTTPFCIAVKASPSQLNSALRSTLAGMRKQGYKYTSSRGAFSTTFVERESWQPEFVDVANPNRWIDSFDAKVVDLEGPYAAVAVQRRVFISRFDGERGVYSPFIQADSEGYLEAWMLATARDKALGA